jgi:hypothetical protein
MEVKGLIGYPVQGQRAFLVPGVVVIMTDPLHQDSTVEVEILGVARFLARRETASLVLAEPVTLREFLHLLAGEVPALVGTAITGEGALLGGYVLCRNATDLIRDPAEPVRPGDRLLLLSTSAGG